MKRLGILLVLFMMCGASSLFAQNEQAEKPKEQQGKSLNPLYELNLRTYLQARKYNDIAVAKGALYRMVVMAPSDSLAFELGSLYYNSQEYIQAVLVMNDVLQMNPNFDQALSLKADGLRRIGALDKSAESYESLYLKTGSINSLYQLAFIQYELKRYAEVKTNADILIKNPKSQEIKLNFDSEDGKEIPVSMDVVLLNLKGMVAVAEGNNAEAKKIFSGCID